MALSIRSSALSVALACSLIGGAVASAQTAPLEGNPVHGKAISYTCLGCHGIAGYRNAYPDYSVPELKGQYPEYLEAALQEYRDGQRSHLTMHAQASELSAQDMADIAVYFAGKPLERGTTPTSAHTPPAAAAVCVACHGTDGVGVVSMYPSLAGQHADYIVQALREYKSGQRKNPVMTGMVATLKDADMKVIAEYYSSLEPGLRTLPRPYTFLTVGH
ncbi:MAG TPA: cytochrome c [Steroidobacteraceae bacterium]|nr:cytochrome c [Steroidobacteraceae bacterium]